MDNFYTEEEEYWCTGGNTGTLPSRITPSTINSLQPGEIFVFGSNVQGHHMGGAAYVARQKFGAVDGIGEGLQGQSYAIPTMEGLESLTEAVKRFKSFAYSHEDMRFFVTPIGCGIAGYTPKEIAPLFLKIAEYENVYLPLDFWKVLMDKIREPENLTGASICFPISHPDIYDKAGIDSPLKNYIQDSPLWFKEEVPDYSLTEEQMQVFAQCYRPTWECRFAPYFMNGWYYIVRSGHWLKKFRYVLESDGLYHVREHYTTPFERGENLLEHILIDGNFKKPIWDDRLRAICERSTGITQ